MTANTSKPAQNTDKSHDKLCFIVNGSVEYRSSWEQKEVDVHDFVGVLVFIHHSQDCPGR